LAALLSRSWCSEPGFGLIDVPEHPNGHAAVLSQDLSHACHAEGRWVTDDHRQTSPSDSLALLDDGARRTLYVRGGRSLDVASVGQETEAPLIARVTEHGGHGRFQLTWLVVSPAYVRRTIRASTSIEYVTPMSRRLFSERDPGDASRATSPRPCPVGERGWMTGFVPARLAGRPWSALAEIVALLD
jgi:hypothetical protein